MSEETIVAVYDTAAHAAAAASDLVSTGVPSGAITQHAKGGMMSGTSATPAASTQGQGFWASLFGGEPGQDASVYDRSLEGGSTVLTVKAPADHVAAVLATLERHGPIDIDERGASYAGTQAQTLATSQTPEPVARGAAAPAATDGTIQLAEESLVVGKRLVNRGTTRIRRYVVETPVEEKVRLHSEKVVVERRPVTDARAGTADFSEKTLEATETDEQAVVSKTSRIVEEVGLRREASDRTETVRDTVRRQDVEIVQEPASRTTTSDVAATPAPRGKSTI